MSEAILPTKRHAERDRHAPHKPAASRMALIVATVLEVLIVVLALELTLGIGYQSEPGPIPLPRPVPAGA